MEDHIWSLVTERWQQNRDKPECVVMGMKVYYAFKNELLQSSAFCNINNTNGRMTWRGLNLFSTQDLDEDQIRVY